MTEIKNLGFGLRPLQKDDNDFIAGGLFGVENISQIPDEFSIGSTVIKDQGSSDACTAYSSCAASEFQEEVSLSPKYQFAKIKELTGEYQSWGADLRVAMKSFVKIGSIETSISPLEDKGRDEFANWKNWPKSLDFIAQKHKKKTFVLVTEIGYKDLFDAIRGIIWKFRDEKRAVVTGSLWRSSWTYSQGGVIPKQEEMGGFGHAFIFTGTKKINNEIYLIAQLSNGISIGDKGFFYFPREAVNRECIYGNFMMIDLSREHAEFLHKRGLSVNYLWYAKLLGGILKYFQT